MTRAIRVCVLGGGSWGTTVAALASHNTEALMWARDADVAAEIDGEHLNTRYLGDRVLPDALRATADLERAVASADVLVVGVPSHSMRDVLREAAQHVRPWVPVISLVKGLEPVTRLRPTQVIAEEMSEHPVGPARRARTSRARCSTASPPRRSSRPPTTASPARCSRCSARAASASTATVTCSAPSSAAC